MSDLARAVHDMVADVGEPPSWVISWGGAGEQPRRPTAAKPGESILWRQPTPPPVGGRYAVAGVDAYRLIDPDPELSPRIIDMRRFVAE